MENESLAMRVADRLLPPGKLLTLSFKNWQWFLLSVLSTGFIALIYLRYTTPTYRIKASILVRDDTKGSDFGDAIGVQGLDLPIGKSNIDNEVEVLKSRSLAEAVVSNLQLYVTYFSTGDVKTSEIYDQSPVKMHFVQHTYTDERKEFGRYEVRLTNHGRFLLIQSKRRWQGHFGDTLKLPHGRAILLRTTAPFVQENKYTIVIGSIGQAVRSYQKSLSLSPANKMVSMINLSWTDPIPKRGETILDEHLKTYLLKSVEDKTRIADTTTNFIDKKLTGVLEEMRQIEQNTMRFRKDHHLADLPESGRILVQNHSKIRMELAENEVQLTMIQSLREYILRNPETMVPASLLNSEISFSETIRKYNELLAVRIAASKTKTEKHPDVAILDAQISPLLKAITDGIDQYQKALMARQSKLHSQETKSVSEMDQVPRKQQVLTDFARRQQTLEELYLFLARKRLETSLSRSSIQGNGRIIDSAKADTLPYHPNTQLAFLVALLTGLGLPIAVIYIRHIGDDRIWDKNEIPLLTSTPTIGRLSHVPSAKGIIPQILSSQILEQFRLLRTGLFQSIQKDNKVIMVTSGFPDEGKSFVSIHLSHALAMAGKRTVLVDLNLRKPVIASHFGLLDQGVTDFLLTTTDFSDSIQRQNTSIPLDIIAAGSATDDPDSLIMNPKLKMLITALSEKYDYVILDTSPAGILADASIIAALAHMTLIVVRKHVTSRPFLESVSDGIEQKTHSKTYLVLNDFNERSDKITYTRE